MICYVDEEDHYILYINNNIVICPQLPTTQEEWMETAKQFNEKWNFPNCGGSIDGKHIRISPPAHSGSFYYNYKGFFSIILLAVVNANYEFMFVDVGKNGRNSDGGVIEETEFYQCLKKGSLNLPTSQETLENLNFVFLADDAFALGEHLLKPFPFRNLTREQRIYNYRLSRARRVVENAFGILANRFRIFLTTINLTVTKIDQIVLCCCILHNFLRRNATKYVSIGAITGSDTERLESPSTSSARTDLRDLPDILTPIGNSHPRLSTQAARQNRIDYMNYFVGSGAVDWQDDI